MAEDDVKLRALAEGVMALDGVDGHPCIRVEAYMAAMDRISGASSALREGLANESLEATGVMERALAALEGPR